MLENNDVYFSFRSPYSYLATPGLVQLQSDYHVAITLRLVLPLAVRDPEFFHPDNLKRARYIVLDWVRRAQFLNMSSHWPSPDPIVQDMTTYKVSTEQPYIHRLSRLGVEAQRQGKGIEFAKEVSQVIFGRIKDRHLGDHLAQACERIGLDLSAMDELIENGDQARQIELNQQSLDTSGHWGVPTMVFRSEPFFGQDRIATLRWRLDQHGLQKRTSTAE